MRFRPQHDQTNRFSYYMKGKTKERSKQKCFQMQLLWRASSRASTFLIIGGMLKEQCVSYITHWLWCTLSRAGSTLREERTKEQLAMLFRVLWCCSSRPSTLMGKRKNQSPSHSYETVQVDHESTLIVIGGWKEGCRLSLVCLQLWVGRSVMDWVIDAPVDQATLTWNWWWPSLFNVFHWFALYNVKYCWCLQGW
jgi:hypothetical protein